MFYTFNQYFLANGQQPDRLHAWLKGHMVPRMKKISKGPILVMDAMVAPHLPQVGLLMGFPSQEAWARIHQEAFADQDFVSSIHHWEDGAAPYESYSLTHLHATPYSPKFVAKAAAEQRIFELRVYHAQSGRQMRALHDRFRGPEIKIFRRCGINPVLYATTTAGALMPNLTYLTPFGSLAEREIAWNTFRTDPEWIDVKRRHEEENGPIPSLIQISLWKATAYSPVR
jgi:hypothetical protein